MSDSSSEEHDSVDWVFYKDRPEWKDITPLPQDDGPFPVVVIAYSDKCRFKFRDVYDYFRAILKKHELSERALELTKDALKLNAANYTVWQYRRQILLHLKKDMREELQYIKEAIEDNPKNYQVWHHRMFVMKCLNDPHEELKFIADILAKDNKNYHAWQYRQWILSTYKLFDDELEYINELLELDVRNNSAWNQRYFVLNHTTDFSEEAIQNDLDFTLTAIDKSKKNESAWNYLKGILFHSEKGILEPKVMQFCEELYEAGERSPHLLAYLLDAYIEGLEIEKKNSQKIIERAREVCQELIEKSDQIRTSYWKYILSTLEEK